MRVKQKMSITPTARSGNKSCRRIVLDLATPISSLKGVGPRREQVLNDHGIYTVSDVLYYFPRRHLDRTTITPISKFKKGDIVTLVGIVETFGEKPIRRGKLFQVVVSDGTGLLNLSWFNGIHYIKTLFKVGDRLAIHGKVDRFGGFTITHPEFDKLDGESDPNGKVIPLYSLTQELKTVGIDQRILRNMIKETLGSNLNIPEIFPTHILKKYGLVPLQIALRDIHFSSKIRNLEKAKNRLKFDEHFFLQLLMALRKHNYNFSITNPLIDIGPYFRTLLEGLKFELTNAQKAVIKEIQSDLKNEFPMNRLLQGDVGCGKTIVSILVTAIGVGNNVQVAIMAPTEILATQHYHSFKVELDKLKIPCALLVGNMKKSDREPLIGGIASGSISVAIGTHALIQNDISFKNLGLVIIDEQHRFGVNQRAALVDKGSNPHFLAMTATPIPRTLSITYHGDMNLSIIDEMPANRIPVKTKVVNPNRLSKVYHFIKKEVNAGRQCMIIYPLVEESEKSDLAAAVEAYKDLNENIFINLEVGLVHGKMKSDEKENIINKFINNHINVLVSTTVIEVGFDIPNATVMVIEHAERFGLTQLHQLRGRVGRGSNKSYCILVKRNITDSSRTRLAIMEKTSDGFVIADEDLKLRGPGEFFGIKQSGFLQYKIANMVTDGEIIKEARKAAFAIVNEDPNLHSKSNSLIREIFVKNYSGRLEGTSIS